MSEPTDPRRQKLIDVIDHQMLFDPCMAEHIADAVLSADRIYGLELVRVDPLITKIRQALLMGGQSAEIRCRAVLALLDGEQP